MGTPNDFNWVLCSTQIISSLRVINGNSVQFRTLQELSQHISGAIINLLGYISILLLISAFMLIFSLSRALHVISIVFVSGPLKFNGFFDGVVKWTFHCLCLWNSCTALSERRNGSSPRVIGRAFFIVLELNFAFMRLVAILNKKKTETGIFEYWCWCK